MGVPRKLQDAGLREAWLVSWRKRNGPSHLEAFATEAGAHEFVRRNQLKAHIYKGVVMSGLFPADVDRGRLSDVIEISADAVTEGQQGGE